MSFVKRMSRDWIQEKMWEQEEIVWVSRRSWQVARGVEASHAPCSVNVRVKSRMREREV
jgi:hypothetical protein